MLQISLTYVSFCLEQAALPSRNNFAFGYGPHSCPGRFFAVHEMKLVIAHIVTHYDFKLKDRNHQTPLTRPVGLLSATDPSIEFLFKRRNDLGSSSSSGKEG